MYNWWWLLIKMKPFFDANGNEYESWKSRELTVHIDFILCSKWKIYCCWAYRKQCHTRVTSQPFDPFAWGIFNHEFYIRRAQQLKMTKEGGTLYSTNGENIWQRRKRSIHVKSSRSEWNETGKSWTRTTKMLRFIFLFCLGSSRQKANLILMQFSLIKK